VCSHYLLHFILDQWYYTQYSAKCGHQVYKAQKNSLVISYFYIGTAQGRSQDFSKGGAGSYGSKSLDKDKLLVIRIVKKARNL